MASVCLWGVIIVAGVLRVGLIPSRYGADFTVWRLAADATLHGTDIFRHRPAYPGGPYAYLPLWVWIEVPLAWTAHHSAVPFTVAGKIPILIGDIAVAALIAHLLNRRGRRPATRLAAGAAWFANPLVIYNGDWYGRFDSVALAFLLSAVAAADRTGPNLRSSFAFALAVGAKTFPVVALPIFAKSRQTWLRTSGMLFAMVAVLIWPYQHSLRPLLHDTLLYNLSRPPEALSWQMLMVDRATTLQLKVIDFVLLTCYLTVLFVLSLRLDADVFLAVALMLFLIVDKVVVEQYLIWPLPWLILLAATRPNFLRWASVGAAAVLTVMGCLFNTFVHPFGQPHIVPELILVLTVLAFSIIGVSAPPRGPAEPTLQAEPVKP